MKAKELAKLLLENPESEVVIMNDNGEVIDCTYITICNKGEELQEGSSRSQYLTGSTPYKWPVSTKDIIFIGGEE